MSENVMTLQYHSKTKLAKLLLETRVGDWLLSAFERLTGLIVVDPEQLD